MHDAKIIVKKRSGRVEDLQGMLRMSNGTATMGMGHTRWATHGAANGVNAHPHVDCTERFAIVHNGIIENCVALRKMLESEGHHFRSATDTEVLVHLIEDLDRRGQGFERSVRNALREVVGTYGIVVMDEQEPKKLIAARKGSPLVIGIGEEEYIIASDPSAIVEHTHEVIYLGDEEIATVTPEGVTIKNLDDVEIKRDIEEVTYDLRDIEKGRFGHYMLKEIHEQPQTIENAFRGRIMTMEGSVKLGGIEDLLPRIDRARRLVFVACGTSWHAALVGKYMLEQYANKSVNVEYGSEFPFCDSSLGEDDVVFCISQSGETADTLAGLRAAKARGATVLGICNVVGSTLARESDGGIYIHAGPEIGVASTKAFTSQLTVLALLTLLLARRNGLSPDQGKKIVRELKNLPAKVRALLVSNRQIEYIAREFHDRGNFLYLGRGYNFPVALEGALKLKEISYIHAEGYPAAEMKHGPIALIDERMPVVFIAPHDDSYEKIMGNIEEVKARGGKVIVIANEITDELKRLADYLITIPSTLDLLSPILSVIPLQLLAYHIGVLRGCDVDRPRNLAKSVTVE